MGEYNDTMSPLICINATPVNTTSTMHSVDSVDMFAMQLVEV